MEINKRRRARLINNIIRNIKMWTIIIIMTSLFISIFFNYWYKGVLKNQLNNYEELQIFTDDYIETAEKNKEEQETEIDELSTQTQNVLYNYVENSNYNIVTITAYSDNDPNSIQGTTTNTSIGFKTDAQYMDYINLCAVDPTVTPYGSFIYILFTDGVERKFVAGDTGALVIGSKIDILMTDKLKEELYPGLKITNKDAALKFGTQARPTKISRATKNDNS